MNSVNIVGNLGKDPEIRATESGTMATFSLAVRRSKDKTDWINCIAFDKTAEILEMYVKKGQQVAVSGRLQEDKWEQEGQPRRAHKVVVSQLTLLKDGGAKQEEEDAPPAKKTTNTKPKGQLSINDDEIPF